MVEHKRLVSSVERQRKSLLSPYPDERKTEPVPNRAKTKALETLLTLFCLAGRGFLCPPPFLGKTENLRDRVCFLLAVLLPLVFFSVTAYAQSNGDLRLCDTTNTSSCTVTADIGRLEVYYNDGTDAEWRGVCDDYFTSDDAKIACGQLKATGGQHSDYMPEFAKTLLQLDGPSIIDSSKGDYKTNNEFWLDDILCVGTETRLIDCPRGTGQSTTPVGTHNCKSFEHAGVVCSITAPGPPRNLEAEPKGQSMIVLKWRAPNSYVEGYKIEVSEDGVSNWTDLEEDTGNTDTTYTHSGLSPGDTRHYRVSAINSEGTSDPSNIANATTEGVPPPDQPGTVTLSGTLAIDEELTATLTDPDGSITDVEWTWYRSADKSSWNPITGAASSGSTTATYTPVADGDPNVEDDEDKYLRAVASYTDGHGPDKNAEAESTGKVPAVNWAPYFDPDPPPDTFSVAENTGPGVNIGAPIAVTDPENETLTYSLDDVSKLSFDIDSSGQIKTKAPLDYETKSSYAGVVVKVTDGTSEITTTVTISVTDVEEDGEVTLSSRQPQVGTELKATLTDPDDSVSGETWTWEKSTSRSRTNGWGAVSGTPNGNAYTPVSGDVGNYLRAKVTYTDRRGSGKMAYEVSDLVTRVEPPSNNAPYFQPNTATRSVPENTPPGRDVGAAVTATDPDSGDQGSLTYSLGGTDAASFALEDQTSGQIQTKAALDYEGPKRTYTVTVTARDPGGLTGTITVTINVTDVNENGSPGSNTKTPPQVRNPIPSSAVPGAPSGLTAASGDGRATLNWGAPDDGGSPIKYYEYKVDDGEWTSTGGKTTSYTVTGLTNGETYGFRVRAVNGVGPGPASEPTSATPATVPGAPRNLEGTRGNGEVALSWDAPDNGGSSIERYEYRIEGGPWTSTGGTTTSYTVTGLTNGETYGFRVRAVNGVGPGPASEPARVTLTAVPGAPSGLTAASGDGRATLNWGAPDDGGSPIKYYEYKVDDGEWTSTGGKTTSYTVTGLTNGETYGFRVRAVNGVGPGPASEPTSATPATVPGAPRSLTATPGDQRVTLVWERPADNGGLPITGYEYSQKEENGSFGGWTSIDQSGPRETNETSYTVTGLENGTVYSFRVRAVNDVGPGDPSAEATAEANTTEIRRARHASLRILPTFGRTMLRNSVDALTWRLDSVLSGSYERTGMFRLMDQHAGLHEVIGTDIWDDPDQWEALSLEELLYGSSFIIEAGGMLRKPKKHPQEDPSGYVEKHPEEDPKGHVGEYPQEDSADNNMWVDEDQKPVIVERRGSIGFWGKADYNNLSVASDEWFKWDGRIVSGYMGVDRWLNEKVLTGLSLSLTKGNFDYTDTTPGEGGRGDYHIKMVSVSPYVSWFLSEDVYLWSALGYGRGQIDIDDEGARKVATSDLSYKSVAAGGNGRVFDVGDTTFSLKSEAFKVWMDVEGDDYMIEEMSLGVHQLRLSMEGSYEYRFASGTWFNPLVEVALRHDGGDGETGTGVEIGGGFLYENPSLGLSISGRGRWLAAHSSEEFSQWGVGGSVIFDTGADKRGVLFSVAPEWGDTSSGVDSLWERGVDGLSSEDNGGSDMHLDAEFGYGLAALGGDGLLTPYSGLRLGGDGRQHYRLGSRLDLGRSASLSLETERRQSDTAEPEHGVMLRGEVNF